MASVTQLAQFLLTLNPQAHVARLSFYHWVKNFLDLNAELKASMIDEFYSHALLNSYWQTHQKLLGETVAHDLSLFGHSQELSFDPKGVRHSHQFQIVELSHAQDSLAAITRYFEDREPGRKVKILPINPQKILTIQATSHHGLIVQVFSQIMMVNGAHLQPISPLSDLRYDPHLELIPGAVQILQTGHSNWSRFQLDEDGCHGLSVTGYTFQKTEAFLGKNISHYPELYYGLKQLERFYIDLNSDPLYQELISLLERALNMAGTTHPEAYNLANTALKKGRLALKNIFPNDKLLRLLITNLEYRITGGQPSPLHSPLSEKDSPCPEFPVLN